MDIERLKEELKEKDEEIGKLKDKTTEADEVYLEIAKLKNLNQNAESRIQSLKQEGKDLRKLKEEQKLTIQEMKLLMEQEKIEMSQIREDIQRQADINFSRLQSVKEKEILSLK